MSPASQVIDRSVVRWLASWRGEPVVTSLYLDVDGAHRPVRGEYEQAFERLSDEVRRRARSLDDPEALSSVSDDLEMMRSHLDKGIDRSTTRGLALFSCSAKGWFEALELPVGVRDEVGVGQGPYIRQLAKALGDPNLFLLVIVDRVRLRLFTVLGHDVHEIPVKVQPQERSVDTSVEIGSFERHEEELARIHLRMAAEEVDQAVRTTGINQIVIGGPGDAVAELERQVHATTRELIVGHAGVRVAAPVDQIVQTARVVADRVDRDREAGLVEELRQRAAGEYGGVVGLEATLGVLEEHRVGMLLVSEGFSVPGARCPSCGHVGAALRQCPVCGTTNVEIEDVVELAIEQAVAQGATIEFCRNTELERFGNIGAIERY